MQMWTEPLKNGKYRAAERYLDPITGKQKKVSVTIEKDTRTTRKEAQKILDQKIKDILGKTNHDDMTLSELFEKYLDTIKKPSSKDSLRTTITRLKNELGSNARVNYLTASYVSEKLKSNSDTTFNYSLAVLKAAIRWGYSADYIADKSWLEKVTRRKDNRKERIEDKYLEQSELTALLESMAKDTKWQLLTKFLSLSGLRIGEALALTINDLDEYIHVTKTLYLNLGSIADTPKSSDSNRDVFIQPELAVVISDIRKWRLVYMMRTGVRMDLLFPGLTYRAYRAYLTRKSQKILGRQITPHTLRHTHASLLAAAGVSLEAISRRLGHADSTITREVYFHVTEKLREKENAQLAKVTLL